MQRLLEEAAAAATARGLLETQLDAARAAVSAARLDHETTKVRAMLGHLEGTFHKLPRTNTQRTARRQLDTQLDAARAAVAAARLHHETTKVGVP